MKTTIATLIFLSLFSFSCDNNNYQTKKNTFDQELTQLKEYFKIPGLSALVIKNGENLYEKQFGFSDVQNQVQMDDKTLVPMASLTKIFAATLIMKLVEENKLDLEDPISKYIETSGSTDQILVKHILSHTSQGTPGEQFYYSSRFGILTTVIEKAGDDSFENLMQTKILTPLKLEHTFLLNDSTQSSGKSFAKPYVFEGEVKEGFIDYGFSSSAGIVSTVKDLALFNEALDKNSIISETSKAKIFTPLKQDLAYGHGIFSQKFLGKDLIWGYGQYDCYSSLFLKVPQDNITLILAANNNLMSDPARLIYGDVTYSLFAMSFLKNFVFEQTEMHLFKQKNKKEIYVNLKDDEKKFLVQKLLAQAIAESFMARFDDKHLNSSKDLLNVVFKIDTDYLTYADLTLLHNLTFLKDVAFYKELGEFNHFDKQIESISEMLLKKDPQNPYANYYLGNYFDRKGSKEKAEKHFKAITESENFSRNWYTSEAENWLKQNARDNDN